MKARLLIVDDEAPLFSSLTSTLEREGYAATMAHSAAQALSILRSNRFDILVTDLLLPDGDGIALLRAAQSMDAELVGIVMAGHGTIDTAVEAMKSGALDYLLKPLGISTILPVLSRAVAVRRLRGENTALLQRVAEHSAELETANRQLRAVNRELDSVSATLSRHLLDPLRDLAGLAECLLRECEKPLSHGPKDLIEDIARCSRDLAQVAEELIGALPRHVRKGRKDIAS